MGLLKLTLPNIFEKLKCATLGESPYKQFLNLSVLRTIEMVTLPEIKNNEKVKELSQILQLNMRGIYCTKRRQEAGNLLLTG